MEGNPITLYPLGEHVICVNKTAMSLPPKRNCIYTPQSYMDIFYNSTTTDVYSYVVRNRSRRTRSIRVFYIIPVSFQENVRKKCRRRRRMYECTRLILSRGEEEKRILL